MKAADETAYEIRQCEKTGCGFRYPVASDHPRKNWCPYCKSSTRLIRVLHPSSDAAARKSGREYPLVGLLDNLRSSLNVGSIFRTAEGAGLNQLILCGITPTPESPKVAKTSLGAEKRIHWEYRRNALDAAQTLRNQGYYLIGLETGQDSHSIYETRLSPGNNPKLALIVGNEITGIDPELLSLCDEQLELPMHGLKSSINVAVAFGAAVYYLLAKL